MPAAIDLTGHTFEFLTVEKRTLERDCTGSIRWKCRCVCGKSKIVASRDLKRKGVTSCGCKTKEIISKTSLGRNKKHGAAYDKAKGGVQLDYSLWHGMKDRCYNKNNRYYQRYGGRGIKLCTLWKNNFEEFAKYIRTLPDCPEEKVLVSRGFGKRLKVSMDRVHNDKDYKPGNLKWSTRKEQNNNRSSNITVKVYGKKLTLAQACEQYSIVSYKTLHDRLFKLGWGIEKALTTPSRTRYGGR